LALPGLRRVQKMFQAIGWTGFDKGGSFDLTPTSARKTLGVRVKNKIISIEYTVFAKKAPGISCLLRGLCIALICGVM
jgi:hypothetical protein